MKKIERAYYYLFYKLYKFSEAAPSRWMSDMKAGIVIIVLEIWLLLGLITYYNVFINRYYHLEKSHFLVAGLIIICFNYFMFVHRRIWKEYIKEFDQLPNLTNRIGGWIVFGVILLIIFLTINSLYLKSNIDWSQYR